MTVPRWDDAACRGLDPDIWFPPDVGWAASTAAQRAKAICERCPLLRVCAEYAIPIAGIQGIWGGLSTRERERIRVDAA